MNYWWQVTIHTEPEIQEELSIYLIQIGANGCLLDDQKLISYFYPEKFNREKLENTLTEFSIKECNLEKIPEENWVQMNSDSFKTIQIGDLNIMPVVDFDAFFSPHQEQTSDLYVIPGMGFGSGHHPTTHMMLELMQSDPINSIHPDNILDFGTGSGILSIAAAKLFPESKIIGIDNDAQALTNAQDNIKINNVNSITLSDKNLSALSTKYDLVLANIFLSVLNKNQNHLKNLFSEQGLLLLSGITEDQTDELLEEYRNWEILGKAKKENWRSFILKLN